MRFQRKESPHPKEVREDWRTVALSAEFGAAAPMSEQSASAPAEAEQVRARKFNTIIGGARLPLHFSARKR